MMKFSKITFKIGDEVVKEYKNIKISDLPEGALRIMDTCNCTQYDETTDTLIVTV